MSNAFPRLRRHGGLLLALACFGVYLLLARESGYGDGPGAILEIRAGNAFEDPIHYLYMPMVLGMSRLLAWLGLSLSLFQVGYVTSALGAAVGVGILYAATRRLASGDDPLLVAALVACCPAVVFFGTVVEYHGPFFAFSSLATYGMVCLARKPRWPQAVLVGLATALAYLAHASAHLLPLFLVLCLLALWDERQGDRRSSQGLLSAILVTTHVTAVLVITFALKTLAGASVSSDRALAWVQAEASRPYGNRLHLVGPTLWFEVLWPYLPLSVIWLVGFRSSQRPRPGQPPWPWPPTSPCA